MLDLETPVYLYCGFFIIVLDLRLTKLVRGCRETAFNCFITSLFFRIFIESCNIQLKFHLFNLS